MMLREDPKIEKEQQFLSAESKGIVRKWEGPTPFSAFSDGPCHPDNTIDEKFREKKREERELGEKGRLSLPIPNDSISG